MAVAFIERERKKTGYARTREGEKEGKKDRNDPRQLMTSRCTKSVEKLRLQVVEAFLRLRVGERRGSANAREAFNWRKNSHCGGLIRRCAPLSIIMKSPRREERIVYRHPTVVARCNYYYFKFNYTASFQMSDRCLKKI